MSMPVSEESILDALHKVPQEQWAHVLEFLHEIGPKLARSPEAEGPRIWTIADLLSLPSDQRDAILEAQAALAEADYRGDPELTAFEAFGANCR